MEIVTSDGEPAKGRSLTVTFSPEVSEYLTGIEEDSGWSAQQILRKLMEDVMTNGRIKVRNKRSDSQ